MEYIAPAALVLAGNLFAGPPGSPRWEIVTALYGWAAVVSLPLWLVFAAAGAFGGIPVFENISDLVFFPTFVFGIIQATTRDCEKILKPVVEAVHSRRRAD